MKHEGTLMELKKMFAYLMVSKTISEFGTAGTSVVTHVMTVFSRKQICPLMMPRGVNERFG